jgi:hypothetical protein
VDRHARQARLAEIGAAGQARIERAVIDLRLDGFAAEVAVRYLAGAGVACVRVCDAVLAEGGRGIAPGLRVEVDPALADDGDAAVFDLRDPDVRDLARGARAALIALRAVLEETS